MPLRVGKCGQTPFSVHYLSFPVLTVAAWHVVQRGWRIAKTGALAQWDDQVLPAQEAAAGAADPALSLGEFSAPLLTPERDNPESRHPPIHLFTPDPVPSKRRHLSIADR